MTTDIILERSRIYRWPDGQLNVWLVVMWAAAGVTLGIFAYFMTVQTQMGLGIPWLFPFQVTVSALTIGFLILILVLIAQGQLMPGLVIVGSFILFVLFLTGLTETAIQLYGPSNSVNTLCNTYVTGQAYNGVSVGTLAYLAQKNICNCWSAAFAFLVVGTCFFLWIIVMAWQVNRRDFDGV